MRHKYRTQDYYRTKTERQRIYYAAGIPSSNWELPAKKLPKFRTIAVKEGEAPVTSKVQMDWYKRMKAGEFFHKPWLFLICSPDDDSMSLSVGYDILKEALETEPRIRVHITESSRKWDPTHEETVFLLTNVYDDLPRERCQMIRDWAFKHEDKFRIICAAGDPAVILRRLRIKFNAVFCVDSTKVTESSFA